MRDVLLVEDDRVVLAAVARLCREEGLGVDETRSVDAALAALADDAYRLALVDLMLPGRSGFDLLEAMAAGHPATPVIMISGFATRDNLLRSFQLGAFDFLPKPFDLEELVGVARRGLRCAERPAGEPAAPPRAAAARHCLGRHAWARREPEGMAVLGAGDSFCQVLGEASAVELPAAGDHLVQGRSLARVSGGGELHRVWSPLSGRVVTTNPELERGAGPLAEDPLSSGWLARIVPSELEFELAALTPCAGAAEAAEGGG